MADHITGSTPTRPNLLQRAVALLQPHMGTDQRDTWLTQAYYFDHRALYDAIDQQGAPADFTTRCVRTLLAAGGRGGRHALSLLLDVVRSAAGEERQEDFAALTAELDQRIAQAPAQPPEPAEPPCRVSPPDRPAVFISYARENAALANRLKADLEAAGHACWLDVSDIPGGDVWLEAIAAGIERAYAFLTLVTPAANASDYVRLEYLHARNRDKRIIPLLGEAGDLPWYLADRQAINIAHDYPGGLRRLLTALPAPPRAEAAVAEDQRSRELAYLHRLQLEELRHTF